MASEMRAKVRGLTCAIGTPRSKHEPSLDCPGFVISRGLTFFRYHASMAHDTDETPGTASRVILSPVLELLFAANLVHSTDPSLVGFDEDWKRNQLQELGPEAKGYLDFATGRLAWATLSLCDYLPISGHYEDWELFRAHADTQPIESFLHVLLNGDISLEEISNLRKRPGQVAALVDRLTCYSRMEPEAAVEIFSEPEAFRSRLLAFVAANRTSAFERRLTELRPRINAQMAAVRERLKGRDPIAVAEELSKKPFTYPRDFRTYTFVPSHFIGRKNLYSWGARNFLLGFSLSQREERLTERSKELSERMKVLGDRTRLDILRLLSEGPSYGKALADRLELTTATVSRQLDQLKEAGLVAEDRADSNNVKLVHLRKAALDELLGQVQGFLGVSRS